MNQVLRKFLQNGKVSIGIFFAFLIVAGGVVISNLWGDKIVAATESCTAEQHNETTINTCYNNGGYGYVRSCSPTNATGGYSFQDKACNKIYGSEDKGIAVNICVEDRYCCNDDNSFCFDIKKAAGTIAGVPLSKLKESETKSEGEIVGGSVETVTTLDGRSALMVYTSEQFKGAVNYGVKTQPKGGIYLAGPYFSDGGSGNDGASGGSVSSGVGSNVGNLFSIGGLLNQYNSSQVINNCNSTGQTTFNCWNKSSQNNVVSFEVAPLMCIKDGKQVSDGCSWDEGKEGDALVCNNGAMTTVADGNCINGTVCKMGKCEGDFNRKAMCEDFYADVIAAIEGYNIYTTTDNKDQKTALNLIANDFKKNGWANFDIEWLIKNKAAALNGEALSKSELGCADLTIGESNTESKESKRLWRCGNKKLGNYKESCQTIETGKGKCNVWGWLANNTVPCDMACSDGGNNCVTPKETIDCVYGDFKCEGGMVKQCVYGGGEWIPFLGVCDVLGSGKEKCKAAVAQPGCAGKLTGVKCKVGQGAEGDAKCAAIDPIYVCNDDNIANGIAGAVRDAVETVSGAYNGTCGYGCLILDSDERLHIGDKFCGRTNPKVAYTCENPTKVYNVAAFDDGIDCSLQGKTCQNGECVGKGTTPVTPVKPAGTKLNVICQPADGNSSKCEGGILVECTTDLDATCRATDPYGVTKSSNKSTDHSFCFQNKASASQAAQNVATANNTGNPYYANPNTQTYLNFSVECTDGLDESGTPITGQAESACDADSLPADSTYKQNGEKNPNSANNSENPYSQTNKGNQVPQIVINEPTGTVKENTFTIKATTSPADITTECWYGDSTTGISATNYSAGLRMSDSGTAHTATVNLTSLKKRSVTYTVACRNTTPSYANTNPNSNNYTTTTTMAMGQNAVGIQTFTVNIDLSENKEYAPKITSKMSDKYDIPNPVLKIETNVDANCQYNENSSFTYGSGKPFGTTGSREHNVELKGLNNNNDKAYVYYVACQDKEIEAKSEPLKIEFKVDLSQNETYMPKVTSDTPAKQTVANPTLAVSTDRNAACKYKYKKDSESSADITFDYDKSTDAVQFTNDGAISHTVSLTSFKDDKYTFYVICQSKDETKVNSNILRIQTELDREADEESAPVISNTTNPTQTTITPTLSVLTTKAANCQYRDAAGCSDSTCSTFTYSTTAATQYIATAPVQFAVDGSTGHSGTVGLLTAGPHTFYVICKDTATGAVNKTGTPIMFTVNDNSEVCAALISNDRVNDGDRDTGEAETNYVWRSVEKGTKDRFSKVDWYAGYQFTPNFKDSNGKIIKSGKVTQLCGYFDSGNTYKVTLYNSSYSALVSALVSGKDGWNCVNVTPVAVVTDGTYYVVARIKDGPINFEYKSGLMPRSNDYFTVNYGFYQLADNEFGTNIKLRDYIIFGLVDVKVSLTPFSSTINGTVGPTVTYSAPTGTIATPETKILVNTNVDAVCKFGRDDKSYDELPYIMTRIAAMNTYTFSFGQKVCNLENGDYTFYVRCKGTDGAVNTSATQVQFTISH